MYIRRPCGCRCVQYSILGGKAQGVRAIFLRQWIFSFLVGQGRVIPHPAGGLPSLSPAAPAFSLLGCPHPPDPLPLRGRGRPRLFHARGFAPCIPSIRPPAALTDPAEAAPCGVACLLCRPLPLPLALLLPPSPRPRSQSALPGGKGETKSLFRRGLPPRHPCTEPPAARTVLAMQEPCD